MQAGARRRAGAPEPRRQGGIMEPLSNRSPCQRGDSSGFQLPPPSRSREAGRRGQHGEPARDAADRAAGITRPGSEQGRKIFPRFASRSAPGGATPFAGNCGDAGRQRNGGRRCRAPMTAAGGRILKAQAERRQVAPCPATRRDRGPPANRLTVRRRNCRGLRVRRRGRVAEGGGLLNRYTLKRRIEGSNPSLSAK